MGVNEAGKFNNSYYITVNISFDLK
jgi:hypothetical protein